MKQHTKKTPLFTTLVFLVGCATPANYAPHSTNASTIRANNPLYVIGSNHDAIYTSCREKVLLEEEVALEKVNQTKPLKTIQKLTTNDYLRQIGLVHDCVQKEVFTQCEDELQNIIQGPLSQVNVLYHEQFKEECARKKIDAAYTTFPFFITQ